MTDFVSKLGKTSAFTFAVCTCGDEAGLALKKSTKKYPLNSSYSLVMPNNYIIGADVDAPQIAQAKIEKALKPAVGIPLFSRGKINNRLCQIDTDEKFQRLIADIEFFVDWVSDMRITQMNLIRETTL